MFSDGACEEDDQGEGFTTVGAVLLSDGEARCFGFQVPADVARSWRSGSAWQVVGQAELFPIYVARRVWADWLRDRDVIYWIDNESAKQAMIKGYSPVIASCRILGAAAESEILLQTRAWYARVPTWSNPGDPASRLSFEEVRRLFPRVTFDEVAEALWSRCKYVFQRQGCIRGFSPFVICVTHTEAWGVGGYACHR